MFLLGLVILNRPYAAGDPSPFCGKGKLYPSGLGEVREPAIPPKSGEAKAELREFVCDNCGQKPKTFGRTLTETLGAGAEGQERERKS